MIKKCFTITLALLILALSAVTVLAAKVSEIGVSVDVYTVNVTVTGNEKQNYPLTVYAKNEDGTKGNVLYIGQTEGEPELSEQMGEVNGTPCVFTLYTYTYTPFTLEETAATGTYLAKVGSAEQEFVFVNKKDKIAFYNRLAASSEAEVGGVLVSGVESDILDYDLTAYENCGKEVKTAFHKALANAEFPALSENATKEEVHSFETKLLDVLNRYTQAVNLVTAESGEAFHKAVKEATNLNLDTKFYDDAKLSFMAEATKARMTVPEDLSEESVNEAFDLAVLLALIDKADAGFVAEGLRYYDGECITLSKQYTGDFEEVDHNILASELKKRANTIATAGDIEDAYLEISKEIKEENSTAEEDKRPQGGGGGAGGGGRPSAARPGSTNDATGTVTNNPTQTKPAEPTVVFSDLDSVSWAAPAINYLAEKGVLNGKAEGIFAPNDLVTREEFVKMIVSALHLYNKNAKADFVDVAKDRWSYAYIGSGVEAGLIAGVSEQHFAPAETITRQDMAVITYRGLLLLSINFKDKAYFTDDDKISDYAKTAVMHLAGNGIVNGMGNGTFAPKEKVTRAQAAKIIYELVMKNGGIK